jgi:hypothetical protein
VPKRFTLTGTAENEPDAVLDLVAQVDKLT